VPDRDLARLLAHEIEPSLLSLQIRLRSLARSTPEAAPCLEELEALRALVTDFRALAETDIERRPFPLGPLLESLARTFAPIAAERGLDLRIDRSSAEALGDPGATMRALSSLLDNALKFSRDRGRVEVSVRERAERVEVEVRDQGVGIPHQEHSRVFEPFVRLDKEKPGSGLGLSLARALVEAQGGRIDLASEPGHGASFVLALLKP
jgi:signal transduction histidine kinase